MSQAWSPPWSQQAAQVNLSEDDDESTVHINEEDLDVLKKCQVPLGLSREYTPTWRPKDAFRELYQNWKDGILSSFGVEPRRFKPLVTENERFIKVTVHARHPSNDWHSNGDAQQLMGYIQFDKNVGLLELTNFRARLEREHLDLGQSSKRTDANLAGCHGEGFKLAALVMLRNSYAIKFESNSFYWNFSLRGANVRSTLHCQLNPRAPRLVQKERAEFERKTQASGFRRGLTSNIWEDTTVKVGKVKGRGFAITENNFRSWMKVALDLDTSGTEQIIHTDTGDLMLAEDYAGRIYLKGLRVAGQSSASNDYRFGYNFHHGAISRDRERLVDRHEEAKTIARIWEESIMLRGDNVTDRYLELFQNHYQALDIALAEQSVSRLVTKEIWKRLRFQNPQAFFFSEKEITTNNMITDEAIITKDLGKQPVKLPKELWKLLRNCSLARTPHEERLFVFSNSPPVPVDDHPFYNQITRALTSSLRLDEALRDVQVLFVNGGLSSIDMLFTKDKNLLQNHDKWLDFGRIHETAECNFFQAKGGQLSEDDIFFCDHIVHDLFEVVLEETQGPLKLNVQQCRKLRNMAAKRLHEMPRHVQLSATNNAGELSIQWAGNQSNSFSERYGANIEYLVILHKMSMCEVQKNNLLSRIDMTRNDETPQRRTRTTASCGCPFQAIPGNKFEAVFHGLDHQEHYFPMVSRFDEKAFFGRPPAPVRPAEVDKTPSSSLIRLPTPAVDSDEEMESVEDATNDIGEDTSSTEPASTSALSVEVPPSTLNRRSVRETTIPHRHRSQGGSDAEDLVAPNLLTQDEVEWRAWLAEELPIQFAKLRPKRVQTQQHGATLVTLECPHLNYTFEKDEYACIYGGPQDSPRHVVLVHDILPTDAGNGVGYRLLCTKYSFLTDIDIFKAATFDWESSSDKELVLHFGSFSHMGLESDAEVIEVADIVNAYGLHDEGAMVDDGVEHVVAPLFGGEDSMLFCRFAIRTSKDSGTACLTPLASHLVKREGRWRHCRFTNASASPVFDLSPNILGPSEGFSQSGYSIHAAMGFDPSRDVTWKLRHHASQVYDGNCHEICNDFRLDRLHPLSTPDPTAPKIALLAGGPGNFRLNSLNTELPTTEEFLRPLAAISKTAPNFQPDFVVMLLSPSVLHPRAMKDFSSTIVRLLERKMSVHIKLIHLKDYGLPQDQSVLTVVAAPFCGELPWETFCAPDGLQPETNVADMLRDLCFGNPRKLHGNGVGFICSAPREQDSDQSDNRAKYVYNHMTGLQPSVDDSSPVGVGSSLTLHSGPKFWTHPSRKDRVTVRELARIQGFPDDFVFYGSEEMQYESVCRALPPVIAKKVAQTIRRAIETRSLAGRVANRGESTRNSKRARVEDDTEGL
ncbi:hypothetical protein H2202_009051 [Exophiala xenobiotica]|nr:hypothetical protein H2202_009051 [Exophiala xenobiotica]KAK5405298.1 hypothetical protein LTR06_008993 [Exophiala xenobiotica]